MVDTTDHSKNAAKKQTPIEHFREENKTPGYKLIEVRKADPAAPKVKAVVEKEEDYVGQVAAQPILRNKDAVDRAHGAYRDALGDLPSDVLTGENGIAPEGIEAAIDGVKKAIEGRIMVSTNRPSNISSGFSR